MTDDANLPERVEPDEVSDFERDPLGALGGVDMGSILDVAQSMQSQMMEAQAKLAASVVEGQSGRGSGPHHGDRPGRVHLGPHRR